MSNNDASVIVLQCSLCMPGLYKSRFEPIAANTIHHQAVFQVMGKAAKQSSVSCARPVSR